MSGLDTSVAGLDSTLAHVRHGVGLMSVFIGLDGSPEELGLRAGHVWGFRGADLNTITQEYVDTPLEDIATAKVRLLLISRCQGYSRVIKVIQFLPVFIFIITQ